MKYNLELLKADVEDELRIARLEEDFARVEPKLGLPADQLGGYDRGAIGYYLHNFYNGCENIFRAISRFFENDLGHQTWHADLLKRMKLSIEQYRPAMIDEELYLLLGDFCQIMHQLACLCARLRCRAGSHMARLCSCRHSLKADVNPAPSGT